MRQNRVQVLLLIGGCAIAMCQLRPRRVGVSSTGETEGEASQPSLGDDVNLENILAQMKKASAGAEGTESELDLSSLSSMMGSMDEDTLKQALQQSKDMLAANPEMAEMMGNPEAMKAKMQEVAAMLKTEEGQKHMENFGSQMKQLFDDPEKVREGMDQLRNSPQFASMVDNLPPQMKQVFDDPEAMAKGVEEAKKLFGNIDSSQVTKMMESFMNNMGGGGDLADGLLGSLGSLGLAGESGGGDGDLQERVRKLASQMAGQSDEPVVSIEGVDEEF